LTYNKYESLDIPLDIIFPPNRKEDWYIASLEGLGQVVVRESTYKELIQDYPVEHLEMVIGRNI
jgi:hypothetical protein